MFFKQTTENSIWLKIRTDKLNFTGHFKVFAIDQSAALFTFFFWPSYLHEFFMVTRAPDLVISTFKKEKRTVHDTGFSNSHIKTKENCDQTLIAAAEV